MVHLAPLEIVETWERGAGGRPDERALALLGAAFPGAEEAALAELPIGARDAAILEVRSGLFGGLLEGTTTCETCGETLELVFDVGEITMERAAGPVGAEAHLDLEGYSVAFRLPNSNDLAAIGEMRDVAEARLALLDRCLLNAAHEGRPVGAESIPDEIVDAVEDAMAAADPQADLEIETICPACASPQAIAFDAASFVWAEMETRARRLLRDVHELASAYGWRESEILSLSPARRGFYLELVAE